MGVIASSTWFACDPGIDQQPSTAGPRAIFDTTTATIPLPNDALRNPSTGLMALPPDPRDSPLTQEIKASLNRLDGWLTGSTVTLPFDQEIDPATLTPDTVWLVDISNASQGSLDRWDGSRYQVMFNVGLNPATASPYSIMLKPRPAAAGQMPASFVQGHRYMVVATDGIKDRQGRAVIGTPALEFMRSRTPLVSADGHSLTILPDSQAVQLEALRKALYDPAFTALEALAQFPRSRAVSFAAFGVQSGPRPLFVPLAIGAQLPSPIDGTKPADAELNTSITASIDLPYDPATASAAVKVIRVGQPPAPVDVTVTPSTTADATGNYPLAIQPTALLDPSTTYLVVVTTALKGVTGVPAQPTIYSVLVKASTPLIDGSVSPAALNSPYLDNTLDVLMMLGKDPSTATNADWQSAYTLLTSSLGSLEKMRQGYVSLYALAAAVGIPGDSVAALWSFTTKAP